MKPNAHEHPTAVASARTSAAESVDSATGVVGRALNILTAFTLDEPHFTGTELSRKVGLNKSTVHRLTSALENRGFLVRDAQTRSYGLGPAVLQLAHVALRERGLLPGSYPYMRRLRDRTAETVTLSVLNGRQRICIAQIESPQELCMRLDIGKPIPLYCGAASKVFLASMTSEEVDAIIQETRLKPVGPGSISNPQQLRRELLSIRSKGYAVSYQERTAGGITLAAPILAHDASVAASLSIYAPASRVDKKRLLSWVPLITETVTSISQELGFVPQSE